MLVTICGPNLPRALEAKGTLHVHKAGCADLRKYPTARDAGGWTIEVDTIKDAVVAIYDPSNFDYDENVPSEYSPYRTDVYVAPCVTIEEG